MKKLHMRFFYKQILIDRDYIQKQGGFRNSKSNKQVFQRERKIRKKDKDKKRSKQKAKVNKRKQNKD